MGGLVEGGPFRSGERRRVAGQEAVLEDLGGVADALVPAGVVDDEGGMCGSLPGKEDVAFVVGERVAGAQQVESAEDAGGRDQAQAVGAGVRGGRSA
ncbi:hypothetical protein GCM10010272_30940 [Streptomyces lateritius]|nr:hypothetical protein GCM10010272_30940 [Streptomyces lateritius]